MQYPSPMQQIISPRVPLDKGHSTRQVVVTLESQRSYCSSTNERAVDVLRQPGRRLAKASQHLLTSVLIGQVLFNIRAHHWRQAVQIHTLITHRNRFASHKAALPERIEMVLNGRSFGSLRVMLRIKNGHRYVRQEWRVKDPQLAQRATQFRC